MQPALIIYLAPVFSILHGLTCNAMETCFIFAWYSVLTWQADTSSCSGFSGAHKVTWEKNRLDACIDWHLLLCRFYAEYALFPFL